MARTRDADRTIGALLDAGRSVFVESGFAGAGTEAIVARAGLTRGALYHHFADKVALFEAVLAQMQQEAAAEVRRVAVTRSSPLEGLRAGLFAYLDRCADEAFRQVVLLDGPAVLGWARWHEIDEANGSEPTRRGVAAAIEAGELVMTDPEPLADLLLGMVTQAGLDIGRSDAPAARRSGYITAIGHVLDGLATGF